jgi:hypothetical protein
MLSIVSVKLQTNTRHFGDWDVSPKRRILIIVLNLTKTVYNVQKVCYFKNSDICYQNLTFYQGTPWNTVLEKLSH